ncbi:hypoxanthine phosphoribosyltransferase [Chondrinema litorale]|uniref:hypoxanthine phosphoribosyltransferase n=1 Tax=Chondrinema litorale TaxID=2994555 RepID=UPI00254364E2|nr:hypoxanthine phosphoribosyltransferase [Chondrinema litorale]UZR92468.1 hypoxanthine phosphoribosyltransferase [Chondrinema litorale]
MKVKDKHFKVYLDEEKIQSRLKEIGKQITEDYQGQELVVVGILNGAFMFLADLCRYVDLPLEISFAKYSSYKGTSSTGKVAELIGFDESIKDKNVLIVEDIIDTGNTIKKLSEDVAKKGPASVKIAALLLKPEVYKGSIEIDYLGLKIDNKFVVGYGLDYDGFGRNLKGLYVLDE